jgi:formate hydrogenlyase transcriptional activator
MAGEVGDARLLELLVAGTARETGAAFFAALVRHLADATETRHACVAEVLSPDRARILACWSTDPIIELGEVALAGAAGTDVIRGAPVSIASSAADRYPWTTRETAGYAGVPLRAADGTVIGHLCVFDEAPFSLDERRRALLEIFAARAAGELDRRRIERRLLENEVRLEDLFDEAPIAYVQEDFESRFIRANHEALRILGLRPDQVMGMVGKTLVADTPDAQRTVNEAFGSVSRGTNTSGIVLEMRRADTGEPFWIQWWSKPDPSGAYTRTMFVDITDRILAEREQSRLRAQNTYLQEEIKSVHNFEEIIGASSGLLKVLDDVTRVAQTGATVLVLGETGTGKELIARAIHSTSQRADKPFIKINCAALPAGLVESELFGHEKGAFSGALQRRIGRFELANGGTIFLDEIGEVPVDVQVKLLRVLQEREFERVGSNQTIRTDVRMIAATNRDLPAAVAAGSFRSDLFYRLNVFPISLPPLRERSGDIPLLVKFFVQKYGPRVGRRVDEIDPATMERLVHYPWPGNIRELENITERALILATGNVLTIDPELLPISSGARPHPPAPAVVERADSDGGDLASVQRDHILNTLRKTNWVIEGARGAASALGMKPATLRHRMKKLGISRATDAAAS